MKKFDITYFHGPFEAYIDKPAVIADIAASGITLVPLNGTTAANKRALAVLAKYGLRAVVGDPRIGAVYNARDIAAADEMAREVVEDYRAYDNIIGWDLVDEPLTAQFPILAAIVRAFRRYSPEKETVINLFPNYASMEQVGSPDYPTHLEEFVNIVNPHLISYDHYHFLGREARRATNEEAVSERERFIRLAAEASENRGGFFENIRDVRAVAGKYDIDAMLIVLLTEHGPYRNLTRGELFWEVNMSLAYGFRRISYFTYWEPSHDDFWQWTNAMCDTEGNKTAHYYDVQAINRVISPVGAYLFDKKSTAVYHTGEPLESGAEPFQSYEGARGTVHSIDGGKAVVGFFDDGSFYLVNRDYIREGTFTIGATAPLTIMKDGIFMDLPDNTITLGPGEAALLKL